MFCFTSHLTLSSTSVRTREGWSERRVNRLINYLSLVLAGRYTIGMCFCVILDCRTLTYLLPTARVGVSKVQTDCVINVTKAGVCPYSSELSN